MQMAKTSAALGAAGRGAGAVHLAPSRSHHGRGDGVVRHAGRRHPGRAPGPHRLRRPPGDPGDHPPAACPRASSAPSSCSSTGCWTGSSSARSSGTSPTTLLAFFADGPAEPCRERRDAGARAGLLGRFAAQERAGDAAGARADRGAAGPARAPRAGPRVLHVGGHQRQGLGRRAGRGRAAARPAAGPGSTPRPTSWTSASAIRLDGSADRAEVPGPAGGAAGSALDAGGATFFEAMTAVALRRLPGPRGRRGGARGGARRAVGRDQRRGARGWPW